MNRKLRETRRRNLEILIEEAGSAANLATTVGTNPAYISQIINKVLTPKGTPRGVGDDMATKLEAATDKPNGWMDEPHSTLTVGEPELPPNIESATYSEETIRGAFIGLRKTLPKRRKQLTPEEEADIFIAMLPVCASEPNQNKREEIIDNLINFEERRSASQSRFNKDKPDQEEQKKEA